MLLKINKEKFMTSVKNINSVLNRIEDWDSNWNDVLRFQSEENKWDEKQEINFLYREELSLRKCLEQLLVSIIQEEVL
jgi:hypothetical protein